MTLFLRYKSWLVIRPGRLAGGTTRGWTIPLIGSWWGSILGGGLSTLTSDLTPLSLTLFVVAVAAPAGVEEALAFDAVELMDEAAEEIGVEATADEEIEVVVEPPFCWAFLSLDEAATGTDDDPNDEEDSDLLGFDGDSVFSGFTSILSVDSNWNVNLYHQFDSSTKVGMAPVL